MTALSYFLITFFLGFLGVHRFVRKQYFLGVLYLLTFGLFGVGYLIDVIVALISLVKSGNYSLFNNNKVTQGTGFQREEFEVAGVNYYIEDIIKLRTTTSDWNKSNDKILAEGKENKKIFRYNFKNKPVLLIPEENNEQDKNAIIVQIAGEKVGYISRDENSYVKSILSNCDVKFISSFISGGEYKIVFESGESETSEYKIRIYVKIGYVS